MVENNKGVENGMVSFYFPLFGHIGGIKTIKKRESKSHRLLYK